MNNYDLTMGSYITRMMISLWLVRRICEMRIFCTAKLAHCSFIDTDHVTALRPAGPAGSPAVPEVPGIREEEEAAAMAAAAMAATAL